MTSLKAFGPSSCKTMSNLTTIYNLPNSIEYIGEDAFSNDSKLNIHELPESLIYIGDSAFSGCSNITLETIPHGCTYILSQTFYGCAKVNITHFGNSDNGAISVIDNNLTYIGKNAFSKYQNTTMPEEVYIHNSVKFLGQSCFRNYGKKDGFTIANGNGLITLDNYSEFFGDRSLPNILENDAH